MSIALMNRAWSVCWLPTGIKFVLVALCDQANDEGTCFPAVATLARKCSMDERTVRRHLAELQGIGLVTKKMRPGHSTLYRVNPSKLVENIDPEPRANCPDHPGQSVTPGNLSPRAIRPDHPGHHARTPRAQCPDTPGNTPPITTIEPLLNHQLNPTTTTPAPGEGENDLGKLAADAAVQAAAEIDQVLGDAIEDGAVAIPCQINSLWRPSINAWDVVTLEFAIPEGFADDYRGEFIAYWSTRQKPFKSQASASARWVEQCAAAWRHRSRAGASA